MGPRRRPPPFVRAVQARRRTTARVLRRLGLAAVSFLLSALTAVPLTAAWAAGPSLSGAVFEDVNGDASPADGVGRGGVSVHLYQDTGSVNIPEAGDPLFRSTTTDAAGAYAFADVPDGHYWIAVDSTTIAPAAGLKGGHAVTETWAEQTYAPLGGVRFDGSVWWFNQQPGPLYGGLRRMTSDGATSLAAREHIARMEVVGGGAAPGMSLTGIDFGFSFSAITRTGDGDDRSDARSIQGSLRQAIQNGNAILGTQAPLFRLSTADTGYSGGVWTTNLAPTLLVPITDPLVLDATTQTGYGGAPLVQVSGAAIVDGDPNCFTIQAGNSTLRGFAINRCPDDGIEIEIGTGNVVEANFIGTDASGTVARPNGYGISVKSGSNRVGGPTSGQGNLISANTGWGLGIYNTAMGNWVVGNRIGVSASGGALGNGGSGVEIYGGASSNSIGGIGGPSQANVITGNAGAGVLLQFDAGSANLIRGNSIYGNGGLGIDLVPAGVTANDAGDGDTGPNGLQNFPVVTSAVVYVDEISVAGTLASTPSSNFSIDLYASTAGDPSGYGEGAVYLGSANASTDATGAGSFSVTLPSAGVLKGQMVTATATSALGSTSEFSGVRPTESGPAFDQDLADRTDPEGAVPSLPSPATDLDGDILTYSASGLPTGLSISASTGTITGTIAAGAVAGSPYSVVVRVQDPGGRFDTDDFVWAVDDSNLPPQFDQDLPDRSDAEGDVISLPSPATDPDGDPLGYSAAGLPPGLSVDAATGLVSGTILPAAHLGSPYLVELRVEDPDGLFDTDSFTWGVAEAGTPFTGNTFLVAGIGGAAGGDDLLTSFDRSDPDPVSNETHVGAGTGTTSLAGLDVQPSSGRLYGAVGDRLGLVSVGTGVFTPVGATFGSGSGPNGVIPFTSVQGIAFHPLSGVLYAVHNVVGQDDVLFRVDPATGIRVSGAFGGSDYLVINGQAAKRENYDIAFDPTSAVLYAYLSDTGTGDARLATLDPTTGSLSPRAGNLGPLALRGLAFDAEGNAWGVGSPGTGGRVVPLDKVTGLAGTPIVVDDGGSYQAIEFVDNRPPAFGQDIQDRTDEEGTAISLSAAATDPDGNSLTYSATGLPMGLSMDPATGLISGTISYDASSLSPYAVTLRVEDPQGLFATDTFTWTVVNVNRGPLVVDPADRQDPPGASISLGMSATDPDGDSFVWAATGLPPGLAINTASGVISGTISGGLGTTFQVEVTATDTGSPPLSGVARFSWKVSDDLTITKVSDAGGVAIPGQLITYTITVTNPGPGEHTGVLVTDPLPAGTHWVSTQVTFPVDVGGQTVGDTFDSKTYTADSGTRPWLGPWVETNDDGTPSSGGIVIHEHDGRTILELQREDRRITRAADLSGFTRAALRYEWARRNLADADEWITIEVSGDGGSTWTEVATYRGPGNDLPNYAPETGIDISGFATAGFQIRLRTSLVLKDNHELRVDNLFIDLRSRAPQTVAGGAPPALNAPVSLLPGENMVIQLVVRVDDPPPVGLTEIVNTATATSAQQTAAASATTRDVLNRVPVFDQGLPDRTDAEGAVISLPTPATDLDGDPLTYSATGLPPGLAIDPATGLISGTITYDASPGSPYAVEVRVQDPGGLFDAESFTWTVANTNRPPVFNQDLGDRSDPEDAAVALAAPASDPDGEALAWSATGLPPGVSIDAATGLISGTITFEASAGSPYVAVVRVEDPGGLFAVDTFSWTVTDTNRAPILTDPVDQASAEGQVVSLPLSASDPDGYPLLWSAVGLPPGLAIEGGTGVISGTVTYEAAPGSPYTVTVRVLDPGGLEDAAVFTWTIVDTNRPPTFDGDLVNRTDAEGVGVSLPTPATDLDGDPLTWSAVGLPPGLDLDPATGLISGTITYEGSPGSPYAVAVRVQDPGGLYDTDWFTWTVTDTNRAPILEAGPGDRSDAEGDVISLAAPAAADPDGDSLTWSTNGLPPGLAIDAATGLISGAISYEASAGSPYLVLVRVEDPGGLSDGAAFSWVVADTNRPPAVADPGPQGSGEGQVIDLRLVALDPDGDGVTWSAVGLPPGLAIDPVTGSVSGMVSFDAAPGSPYAVTVRATDHGAPSLWGEAQFAWTVSDTNRAPEVDPPGDPSHAEGERISLAVAASDPDGDGLTWLATGLPPDLAIDPATGVISGTISYEASPGSPYAVTVAVTDDGSPSLASGVSFLWVVADTNRAPQVLHPGDQWAAEGDAVTLAPVGSDPDGDALAWSAVGLPPGLAIDPATGVISGTLAFEAAAGSPHAVTVTVDDGGVPALQDQTRFNFSVADTNRAPLLTDPGSQRTAEGAAVRLTLAGFDPDGDPLTWTASGLPDGLAIDPATGVISGTVGYEASAGSPYVVAVTARDDGVPVLSAGFSFTWRVADTNRAPRVIPPPAQRSLEGATVALSLTGWDPDGDTVSWSAQGLPPGLALDPSTGEIAGTLTFETAGIYPVAVAVTDAGTPALSSQASFVWEVLEVNRPPQVVAPASRRDAEGSAVSLLLEGFDPDGDALAWSVAGLPPGLSVDRATGAVSGTLGFNSAGDYVVTVSATDDGSPSETARASFAWTVADTNRAPVVVVPADRTDPEGGAVTLALSGSDADGDALTWSAAGLPPGLAVDRTTGVISGTLGFGAAAGSPYRVTVMATDDGTPSLSAGGAFSWAIGDVDRPPSLGSLPDRSGEVGDAVDVGLTATDPDGDRLTWSASGLPSGVTLDSRTGRLGGSLEAAGVYTVTIRVTAAGAGAWGSFGWMVTAPGAPTVEPIPNQAGLVGEEASLTVRASHPDNEPLSFSAEGLPAGLAIDRDSGSIGGVFGAAGVFAVTIGVTDPSGASATAAFLWVVDEVVDLPPEVVDDFVVVSRLELGGDGVVVVEVLGNDLDPEGEPLSLVGVGAPAAGEARVVEGAVVFRPPAEWLGTVTMPYRAADTSGQEAEATLTITVQAGPDVLLNGAALAWQPPGAAGVGVPPLGGSGTLLGALVQSLHVLRVPLALLGGAVIWSLVLGGALNLGLALRRGLPAVLSRRGRLMAIVMAPQGAKVPACRRPGEEEVVWQYLATDARIKATGRRGRAADREWLEVITEEGPAWVEAVHLTEHLDRAFFAEDHAPGQVLERFLDALRRREPLADLVSRHGLWVAHHAPPVHYPPEKVAALWEDREVRVWKGRNPAYPDREGTFDSAVAAGVLDAYDHPKRELAPDQAAVPSTIVPVEFTNLHFISIGADLIGPERLDQTAWLVHFSYEEGKPRVIGLCREG